MAGRARPRRRWRLLAALLCSTLAALAASAPSTSAASAPIEVTFVKSLVDEATRYYVGSTGDGGTIEMWVSNSRVTGNMQHFDVRLRASLTGGRSFTAQLAGTFNFSTARTLLQGVVTSGWLSGARVREQGQLVFLSPLTFAGTLWLLPATA